MSSEILQEPLSSILKNIEKDGIQKIVVGAFDYLSSSGKKTRQLNFRVTTIDTNIKLSKEHEEFYLCSKTSEEYRKLNISEKIREIIERV